MTLYPFRVPTDMQLQRRQAWRISMHVCLEDWLISAYLKSWLKLQDYQSSCRSVMSSRIPHGYVRGALGAA